MIQDTALLREEKIATNPSRQLSVVGQNHLFNERSSKGLLTTGNVQFQFILL